MVQERAISCASLCRCHRLHHCRHRRCRCMYKAVPIDDNDDNDDDDDDDNDDDKDEDDFSLRAMVPRCEDLFINGESLLCARRQFLKVFSAKFEDRRGNRREIFPSIDRARLLEELECLATWKEGSSRYLVGRLHHNHASSNEDRYRCFVYEKASQTVQGNLNRAAMGMGAMHHDVALPSGPVPEGAADIYRVAQSGDATCNGLSSPMEGSRTMTLKKVSSPGKCSFPNWLTGHSSGGLTWHTLDLARSYTFHPRNASLHVARSNGSSSRFDGGSLDGQHIPGQEDQDVKILCNIIKQTNPAQGMIMIMLVAHFTVGCRSGYMCMAFHRRDGQVIEVQTGSAISRPEEACSPPHFQHSIPYLTLVIKATKSRRQKLRNEATSRSLPLFVLLRPPTTPATSTAALVPHPSHLPTR
uniref:Uncharacterized protein n=1 Tax=Vespula pensylvanica TaxID=30213 RepID=A0A834UHM5_VESPE|nr:hypothetical protein H0235_001700 [Vespula pensylvanica]